MLAGWKNRVSHLSRGTDMLSVVKRSFVAVLLGGLAVSAASAGTLREDKGEDDLEILFAPYLWH